jgi:hypothetical protein
MESDNAIKTRYSLKINHLLDKKLIILSCLYDICNIPLIVICFSVLIIASFDADNEQFITAPLKTLLPFLPLFTPFYGFKTSFHLIFFPPGHKRGSRAKARDPLITFHPIADSTYPNPYSSTFLYTVVNPIFNNLAASTLFPFV